MPPYIRSVSEEEATDELASIYAQDRERMGYVPNFTKALSLRPEVIIAWRALSGAIRVNMDARRYELATIAAAAALRCSY